MKRYIAVISLLMVVAFGAASPAVTAEPGSAFDKLKALAGEWEGQRTDGQPVKVTYQVLSGGHTVVETLDSGEEPTMLTVYHMDNKDIRMTHYCSAGNQPRLKASLVSPDDRVISFEFVDGTNLQNSTHGYINSLQITFLDKDRITHEWGGVENGRQSVNAFTLARAK